jgi:hypothetical protein
MRKPDMLVHKDGTLPDTKCIFVFGSNTKGIHGAGAAKIARERFGAELGVGIGMAGDSYAIPTKDDKLEPLPLLAIYTYVNDFLKYAKENPNKTFWLTAIGTGLAGYSVQEMANLFRHKIMPNISYPDCFAQILQEEVNKSPVLLWS